MTQLKTQRVDSEAASEPTVTPSLSNPYGTTLPVHRQSIDTPRHQPRSVARATLQVRAARSQEAEERVARASPGPRIGWRG